MSWKNWWVGDLNARYEFKGYWIIQTCEWHFFKCFFLKNNNQRPWQIILSLLVCGIPPPMRTQASRCQIKHLCFRQCNFFIELYNAMAVLLTCPWTQSYRKSHFPAIIVGLYGDQTRATGANRSSINYDQTCLTYWFTYFESDPKSFITRCLQMVAWADVRDSFQFVIMVFSSSSSLASSHPFARPCTLPTEVSQ